MDDSPAGEPPFQSTTSSMPTSPTTPQQGRYAPYPSAGQEAMTTGKGGGKGSGGGSPGDTGGMGSPSTYLRILEIPPAFNGTNWRIWDKEMDLWEAQTPLPKETRATALLRVLTGQPKALAFDLPSEK